MELDQAMWLIKNAQHGPEREAALEVLRAYPFVVAKYLMRRDDDYRPVWDVLDVTSDDAQRDHYADTLTLYRSAPPETAHGPFWDSSRLSAFLQVLGKHTPEHRTWRTVISSSDARLLAELITGRARGECIVDADSLDIEEA
jgi:hypothetical protein